MPRRGILLRSGERTIGWDRLTCVVSDPSTQSPLVLAGRLFTHRAFSSAQDDDTRGWKGSYLGDMLRVLGTSGFILQYE